MVERRTPERDVRGSILTQVARKTKTDVKHVNLNLNIMHLYCITNTSIINKTIPLQVITELYIDDVQPC